VSGFAGFFEGVADALSGADFYQGWMPDLPDISRLSGQ